MGKPLKSSWRTPKDPGNACFPWFGGGMWRKNGGGGGLDLTNPGQHGGKNHCFPVLVAEKSGKSGGTFHVSTFFVGGENH